MPHLIGYVDDTNGQYAHYNFFQTLRNFAKTNGWEELMYDDSGSDWYTMLRGSGLTGNENIYIGFRTYQSVANDYFNIAACAMTGYFPANSFYSQPGFVQSGIPLYKDRVDYWITLNAQRITFVCKVGGSVYHTGYVGKFFPYASPMQYPYPMLCAGMFGYGSESNVPATGYSGGRLPYYGNGQMSLLNSDYAANNFRVYSSFVGRWFPFGCYPGRDNQGVIRGDLIDLEGRYPVMPYELFNAGGSYLLNETPRGIYGKLDGVYWVSGRNNYPEYTMTIDGKTFIIFREKNSTSTAAYFAISLDA